MLRPGERRPSDRQMEGYRSESKHFFRPFLEETVERDLNRKKEPKSATEEMEISKEMMVWMILPQ